MEWGRGVISVFIVSMEYNSITYIPDNIFHMVITNSCGISYSSVNNNICYIWDICTYISYVCMCGICTVHTNIETSTISTYTHILTYNICTYMSYMVIMISPFVTNK
jgi:hypothetical protein